MGTPPATKRGIFITLEGGEGVGKTTQAQLLGQRLERLGHKVALTREPGGTSVGEKLRDIIFRPGLEPDDGARCSAAARAQLVAEVIRPALERGETVVCDRYSDSTVAYQGYGRGLDLAAITTANELATGGLRPDLSIFLGFRSMSAWGARQEEQGGIASGRRAGSSTSASMPAFGCWRLRSGSAGWSWMRACPSSR